MLCFHVPRLAALNADYEEPLARRSELLARIGVPYQVFLLREDPRRGIDIDEARRADESTSPACHAACAEKGNGRLPESARELPRVPLLGATPVWPSLKTLRKPSSADDAAANGNISLTT